MATGGEVLGLNMAFHAFRKHFEELLTAIQEPEALAAGLFTRGVITKNLMDEVGQCYDSCFPERSHTVVGMRRRGFVIRETLRSCHFPFTN